MKFVFPQGGFAERRRGKSRPIICDRVRNMKSACEAKCYKRKSSIAFWSQVFGRPLCSQTQITSICSSKQSSWPRPLPAYLLPPTSLSVSLSRARSLSASLAACQRHSCQTCLRRRSTQSCLPRALTRSGWLAGARASKRRSSGKKALLKQDDLAAG